MFLGKPYHASYKRYPIALLCFCVCVGGMVDLMSVIDHNIGTLQPYWQPHNRAVARRIQNMGWRADGGLWLLVRGGGLYLSKGTGVSTAIRLSSLLSCLKISVSFSYLTKLVLRFIFVICHSLDQKQGKERKQVFFL